MDFRWMRYGLHVDFILSYVDSRQILCGVLFLLDSMCISMWINVECIVIMQNLQESNVYLRGIFTKRWRHLLLEIEAKGRAANFVWYNVSYGLGEVGEE